jgi:hypothetical protein
MYKGFSTAGLETSAQSYVIFFSKYFLRQDLNDDKVLQSYVIFFQQVFLKTRFKR